MPQLYLLSVLCNGLTGYLLFTEGYNNSERTKISFGNPTVILILGILSAVTGILKLLSPSMDGILILGDLIPAAAGVIAGIMLIFGIYRQNISSNSGDLDRFGVSLLAFRKPIGIVLMTVAFLHFLIPQALFL